MLNIIIIISSTKTQMTQNPAYPKVELCQIIESNPSCIDSPNPISSTLYEDITGIDNHPQKLEEDYNVLQHPQVGERKYKVKYEQPDYSTAFASELHHTVECGMKDTLSIDSPDTYDDIIGVGSHPLPPKVEDYNVLQHEPQTLRRVEEEEYQVLGEWESQHNT